MHKLKHDVHDVFVDVAGKFSIPFTFVNISVYIEHCHENVKSPPFHKENRIDFQGGLVDQNMQAMAHNDGFMYFLFIKLKCTHNFKFLMLNN